MTRPLIVVTDLDGSLLDHHSYSFDAARPALKALSERGIPLILNSSKTRAEIRTLRETLGNHWPYVTENGAGIFLPDQAGKGERRVTFGMDHAEVVKVLHKMRKRHGFRFTGFTDMDAPALMALTGLDQAQAEQALQRDFSEPLLWQDSEEAYLAFCGSARDHDLEVLRGGRFVHVAGQADKGKALRWLKGHYAQQWGNVPQVIALGDGENDVAMLEASDYPVIIRSPVNPAPAVHHERAFCTEEEGPLGWNQAILILLARLDSETTKTTGARNDG